MKFQEFFEKNRKLLKLNFVLLGTFIFFLGLQFANVCYAATETEITNSGKTVAQWAEEVLNEYNILNTSFLYFVVNDNVGGQYEYKVFVFPDIKHNEYTVLCHNDGSQAYINFVPLITDITEFSTENLYFKSSNSATNFYVLDTEDGVVTVNKQFISAESVYNAPYYNGQIVRYMFRFVNKFGNYQYDGEIYKQIIYTNAENYVQKQASFSSNYNPQKIFDFDRPLEVYDFESYISYESDELGNYIKLNSSLRETNVTSIFFEGANLMNNKTTYTLSTLTNFDIAKVYVNDSSTVKITFKDAGGNVLYTTTKHYDSVNEEELTELFDYDFDVSNSEVGEFNGIWYYKDIDFYIKYNNIYNYYNDNNYGDIVYWPVISFDAIFNNGEVINGTKFYFAFDETYHLSLPGPLLCQDVMASGDEGGLWNLLYPIGMYNFGVDIGEFLSSGNLYSLRINMSVEKLQIDDVGNYIYISTVHNKSVVQNFSTKQNVGIGSVVELQDNDGNDIGFVVVDGNGNIVNESLNEGYTTDSKYVYDINNNVVYTFNSADNGWNLVDKDGVVIKEHTNVTIEDKVQYANDNSFAGNFADTIGTIASTITGSLSALLTSVSGIAALFGSAFSWLPEPIPQLVVFVFSAMAIFALIRFIRGH